MERHCEACEKPVYLCLDDATLAHRVEAGHHVAISDPAIEGTFHVDKMELAYDSDPALPIVK